MTKEIKIWADFACPYSYMEEAQLMDVITKLGLKDEVRIRFLTYQLDPNAPEIPVESMTQHFMNGHQFTEEQTQHLMERITKMASRVGLDYKLATTQVCSTADAHRLMEFAQATAPYDTVVKLNFALFHANFIENLRLSDREVLAGIAGRCGLNTEDVRKMLSGDEYMAQIKEEQAELDARKDFDLIPYMVFEDNSVLQGVISPGAMKQCLLHNA